MTGFENAANVAEETINPSKTFPRALVGGMITAGVIYVLVAMTAALTVDVPVLADSDAALLEVVKEGIIPVPVGVMTILFACIAMVAITNTTLVAVVTQSRILYGMAREDVVPGVFAKVHPQRRSPWVGLVFSFFVVAALLVVGDILVRTSGDRRGGPARDRDRGVPAVHLRAGDHLRAQAARAGRARGHASAPTPRCCSSGCSATPCCSSTWSIDDPTSLIWFAGLLALGVALFLVEYFFGRRDRPPGRPRGELDEIKGA